MEEGKGLDSRTEAINYKKAGKIKEKRKSKFSSRTQEGKKERASKGEVWGTKKNREPDASGQKGGHKAGKQEIKQPAKSKGTRTELQKEREWLFTSE